MSNQTYEKLKFGLCSDWSRQTILSRFERDPKESMQEIIAFIDGFELAKELLK
jgi:hypothetical protein